MRQYYIFVENLTKYDDAAAAALVVVTFLLMVMGNLFFLTILFLAFSSPALLTCVMRNKLVGPNWSSPPTTLA